MGKQNVFYSENRTVHQNFNVRGNCSYQKQMFKEEICWLFLKECIFPITTCVWMFLHHYFKSRYHNPRKYRDKSNIVEIVVPYF